MEYRAAWRQALVSHITIVVEGGVRATHKGKDLQSRCREGFSLLLQKAVPAAKKPKIVVGGSRGEAFKMFKRVIADPNRSKSDFVALLIDSEDPLTDLNDTWEHLRLRQGDQWPKPDRCSDQQVLFMATCMESWIAADRDLLQSRFKNELQVNALPSLVNLEQHDRHDLLAALKHATRNCSSPYAKGTLSFTLLAELNPEELAKHLPSFVRMQRILKQYR